MGREGQSQTLPNTLPPPGERAFRVCLLTCWFRIQYQLTEHGSTISTQPDWCGYSDWSPNQNTFSALGYRNVLGNLKVRNTTVLGTLNPNKKRFIVCGYPNHLAFKADRIFRPY